MDEISTFLISSSYVGGAAEGVGGSLAMNENSIGFAQSDQTDSPGAQMSNTSSFVTLPPLQSE